MSEPERELARCRGFDFMIEDHGMPFLTGSFEGDGWGQGFGYAVDVAFLMRFLRAVGVDSIRDLEGESCWITHTNDAIIRVDPLHKKDGTPFVIAEWSNWRKRRMPPMSAHELMTGEQPR